MRYHPWNDMQVLLVESDDMPSSASMAVCDDCGSVVRDTDRHDKWHAEMAR